MIQMRTGVFETNSSSTHSLVMCNEETWKALKAGDLFIDWDEEKFLTRKEAIEIIAGEINKDYTWHRFYPTREELETMDTEQLEDVAWDWDVRVTSFEGGVHRTITTASGEVVHGLSMYISD